MSYEENGRFVKIASVYSSEQCVCVFVCPAENLALYFGKARAKDKIFHRFIDFDGVEETVIDVMQFKRQKTATEI